MCPFKENKLAPFEVKAREGCCVQPSRSPQERRGERRDERRDDRQHDGGPQLRAAAVLHGRRILAWNTEPGTMLVSGFITEFLE